MRNTERERKRIRLVEDHEDAWEIVVRRAEIAVIQEELATRRIEMAELRDNAKVERLRSREKALRLKAEMACLMAGGTRGDFARHWPSVFIEEVRNHRES